jgi:hypothetical protein
MWILSHKPNQTILGYDNYHWKNIHTWLITWCRYHKVLTLKKKKNRTRHTVFNIKHCYSVNIRIRRIPKMRYDLNNSFSKLPTRIKTIRISVNYGKRLVLLLDIRFDSLQNVTQNGKAFSYTSHCYVSKIEIVICFDNPITKRVTDRHSQRVTITII